jgi:predicted Rossmann fold flavoprotein
MEHTYDLIIVGAGAAGLSAAIAFKRRCKGSVLLIDANEDAGRKLTATGNGRCNLSNTAADGSENTRYFFESLGILTDVDGAGRVYPAGRQAVAVRDALVRTARGLGAAFLTLTRVTDLRRGVDDDFVVAVDNDAFSARQVIVATGGKTCPQYGNLGDGFAFARALGVAVNPIRPALVPLVYAAEAKAALSALSGVRARAAVQLTRFDETVAAAEGEIQFTKDGLSGICIFDLSRYMVATESAEAAPDASGESSSYWIIADLAPERAEETLAALIDEDLPAGLSGIVNAKLAAFVDAAVDAPAGTPMGNFLRLDGNVARTRSERCARVIKGLRMPVSGTKGWKEAQITAGGVRLDALHPKRYESTDMPGLFFVGEVCDVDAPSGGYNLDFAWNSGLAAGKAAGAWCASYLGA